MFGFYFQAAAAAVGEPSKPDLWSELYQAQLMRAKRQSPSNAFEEMIEWTDSGKLWTFPINNEQGELFQYTKEQVYHECVGGAGGGLTFCIHKNE